MDMSNENETLIKELCIFLTIASEKQALCYHILLFAMVLRSWSVSHTKLKLISNVYILFIYTVGVAFLKYE